LPGFRCWPARAAATAANGWFLIGDSVKVVVTALVAKRVHRAYPGLILARHPRLAGSRTLTSAPARSDENEGTAPLA